MLSPPAFRAGGYAAQFADVLLAVLIDQPGRQPCANRGLASDPLCRSEAFPQRGVYRHARGRVYSGCLK